MLYQILTTIILSLSVPPSADLIVLLEKHGWGQVRQDPSLTDAAQEMATVFGESIEGGEPDSAGGHLRFVLEKYSISDVHVIPFTVRHQARKDALNHFPRLLARLERRLAPTHMGVGSHMGPGGWTTTILLVHRGVELASPLPGTAKHGARLRVAGVVRRGYFKSRLLISTPHLAGVQESPEFRRNRRVEVDVHFNAGPGRYDLEIVADSQYGPVVLNKRSVYVGVPAPKLPLIRLKPPIRGSQVDDPAERLMSMVNAHRVSHQVRPLVWDEQLAKVSREHAAEMSRRRVLAHGSPNTGTLVTRLRRAGVSVSAVAENLAEAGDEGSAFRAFLDSPGHARNLLLPGMTHMGIGVVGRYYALTLVRLERSAAPPALLVPSAP